jgi:8-oxo-dGTP diphosphatase
MKKKVLAIVLDKESKSFLLLRNNPHPKHGGDFWFVVTGEVETNETSEEAIQREVKEETNLEIEKIFNLNWKSIYEWNKETCEEENFLVFAKPGKIILNEENIEYNWLKLGEFVKKIRWEDDPNLLKEVLKRALNNEQYYSSLHVRDYRN